MNNERYDKKTSELLYGLYQNLYLKKNSVKEGYCLGCGIHKGRLQEEENLKRTYCGEECQEIYHRLFLFGQKRLREGDSSDEDVTADGRTFHQFLQVLDIVDRSLIVPMIIYAFPQYETDASDLRKLLDFRSQSKQIKELVDEFILRKMTQLPRGLGNYIDQEAILLFENLTKLDINGNDIIRDISYLTKLEELAPNKLITDISKLTKLNKLLIDVTNREIAKSFKNLINLTDLQLAENDTLEEGGLRDLISLKYLTIKGEVEGIRESITVLTNLTTLSLIRFDDIDSEILHRISPQLIQLKCQNCRNITRLDLGIMRNLSAIAIISCPLEEIRTISPVLRNNQLVSLTLDSTEVVTLDYKLIVNLTYLDISNSRINGKDLARASKLKVIHITNSTNVSITDLIPLANTLRNLFADNILQKIELASLNKLTNLILLDLSKTKAKGHDLNLPKLRYLYLNKTKNFDQCDIASLPVLYSLSLENNYPFKRISRFTSLQKLSLKSNKRVKSEQLTSLVNLTSINLENNDIIDGDILRNHQKLRKIVLYDGSITDDYRLINSTRKRVKEMESDSDSEIY